MAKIARYVRDRPNDFAPHSDGSGSMSSFVISSQIRRPVMLAALEVIGIAKAMAPKESGEYSRSFAIGQRRKMFMFKPEGEPLQPRALVEVINTAESAPAIEFGSGKRSVGDSAGDPRPQGGGNKPFRILGRAGARVGDFHE